ncbi:MAG: SAM-dependent methyltransferase [Candidatus Brocadia sp.]|nr:Ubiquinone/menaquinone biosynthesis C-methyltransferase UbiE [Candidatus Brocadia fulgida]MCC6326697.1 class I SAM-dependent methyltransferase [Candidatus Brocadia sp.]MCE7911312.1 class I SAM-dependent methyltransferase [Candidatus Brocadia sp. AMX3]MDG5996237.1 class I SAM-dependent methyltransferase [Candidatus Brocadia sp.]RIK01942.1 MAG: SAM-dependent methyltransferase [Candidatus Brocadia sp.]
MGVFGDYAKYYNLLYKDKDYQTEVHYIENLIKKYAKNKVETILDIGCGTGNHDVLFAKRGYEIYGIDRSEEMIHIAKSRSHNLQNINFSVGNSESFTLDKKFDVVVSLFHVMSYQIKNESLYGSLKNAYDHLKADGLFIFDFWYGPAVLTDRPSVRLKELEDASLKIYRIATPVMHSNENIVDVNFEVFIEDKVNNKVNKIKETHRVRYLFLPELQFMLQGIGFTVIDALEWMSLDKELSFTSWNGVLVAQK